MASRNVEITTAHNIRIDYELATVSDRTIAFIIDMALILGWFILISIVIENMEDQSKQIILSIFFFPVLFLYHLTSEIFFSGQSIGKKSMGIKVIRMNGHNPLLGDCLLRWALRIVDIIGSLGSLSAILVSSTDKGQRLGDMAANTVVIKLNPPNRYTLSDILKINDKKSYLPTYGDVQKFTDEDMLLIKNAIERSKLFPNSYNKRLIDELCEKVKMKINISEVPGDKLKFLKTILQDYIVLTR